MKIWVDDLRARPKGYNVHLCSVNEAIEFLKVHYAEVEVLDLDHDAGIFKEDGGDYIKILDWLEENEISVPIAIHSWNIQGIINMERIIARNNWEYIQYDDRL